ncbi:hypothetical protein ANCDUO_11319 [Ancylostoma duodenale]|uniref:Uncharacterized protein n=1 Tax=Ancylostoma duodenale TaxID=51022 RepID=A0A0C2CP34_9BILA|nr:hypothetical protein ANCDUO_11319 [Ancylostoma duodenale]
MDVNAGRQKNDPCAVADKQQAVPTVMEQMECSEAGADQVAAREREFGELKVCNTLAKKVKEAEIMVNAEVAKYWRIGDEKREKFEEVARSSTEQLVDQITYLKELCIRSKQERDSFEQIKASLGCETQLDFVQSVEMLVEKAAIIEAIKESTDWPENEIVNRCANLEEETTTLARKNEEIVFLQKQLEARERELEEFTSSTTRAGEQATANVRDDIPGEPKTDAYLTRQQTIRRMKQDWCANNPLFQSGHEWPRTSNAWIQHNSAKSTERKPDPPGQLASQFPGEVSEGGSCASSVVGLNPCVSDHGWGGDHMNTYLKYIALPEVRVYSGRDRNYTWENFIEAFSLKYPAHSWSGEELKALLKSKLTDKAMAQYEALPAAVRHGPFEGLIASLANSNKVEARTNRIIALGILRKLRKTGAQSVAEYCVELERWSVSAYPELDKQALATARAQQLYEQLVNWPESYHLLEAMERDGPNAYMNLKEAAMRVERRRLTMDSVRDPSGGVTQKRHSDVRAQPWRETAWVKDRITKAVDPRKDNRNGSGEPPDRNESLPPPRNAQIKCYKR